MPVILEAVGCNFNQRDKVLNEIQIIIINFLMKRMQLFWRKKRCSLNAVKVLNLASVKAWYIRINNQINLIKFKALTYIHHEKTTLIIVISCEPLGSR